jgi:hypothetical protein
MAETAAFPHIKSFPPGWEIIDFHECGCGHDRDAVVLCERTVEDGDHGTRYVVWSVNMELGGCYSGSYQNHLEDARRVYDERKSRLR